MTNIHNSIHSKITFIFITHMTTKGPCRSTNLVLELPVNVTSYRVDCWNSGVDQS